MTDRIKRGDLKPDWSATVMDGEVGVDLSTAAVVRVVAKGPGFSFTRIASSAGADGKVTMLWQTTDTDTVGPIDCEVEVEWPGGKKQTFPPRGYVRTQVYEDLG